MTKKRIIGLGIYAVVIIAILIFIIFFAPSKWFSRDYSDYQLPQPIIEPAEEIIEVDYETQKNNLKNNVYKYTYNIMDSMNDKSYLYECSGEKNKDQDLGSCTLPERVEYTSSTKLEALKNVDTDLLNPEYIFDLVKDITPQEINNEPCIDYTYNLKYKNLKTEILIRSSKESITDIIITNAYMQYHLKFSDIKV